MSNMSFTSLKTIDCHIRWLREPKHTTLARLFLSIPVLILKRITLIKSNDDPLISTLPV